MPRRGKKKKIKKKKNSIHQRRIQLEDRHPGEDRRFTEIESWKSVAVYLSKERTNRPASIRTSDWRTRARCRSHGGSAASRLQTHRLPRENSSAHAHQRARAAHDKLKTVRSADDFIGVRYLRFERIFFASMIINWILCFGDDYTRRERENLKIVERSENENPFDENLTSFVTYA